MIVSWLIPFGGCTTSCGIGGATGREVLVITEQDRLGRSVCDLIDLTEALHDGASPQEWADSASGSIRLDKFGE